jgi:hypothetical protein
VFYIGSGFAAVTVWSPYQITGYFFVLSIALENGINIHDCDWPQQETEGLESIRWHGSELREALEPSRSINIVGIASIRLSSKVQ